MDIPGLPVANVGSRGVMGTPRSKIHQNGKTNLGFATISLYLKSEILIDLYARLWP